mmetsp:Transcript_31042/g.68900  ORF Transcript_31042/g.68900 Transcript_31042/m.68900 type:complete len:358 (-) Transcript_31042:1094-2167(-)
MLISVHMAHNPLPSPELPAPFTQVHLACQQLHASPATHPRCHVLEPHTLLATAAAPSACGCALKQLDALQQCQQVDVVHDVDRAHTGKPLLRALPTKHHTQPGLHVILCPLSFATGGRHMRLDDLSPGRQAHRHVQGLLAQVLVQLCEQLLPELEVEAVLVVEAQHDARKHGVQHPDRQLGRHTALEHEAVQVGPDARHVVVLHRQDAPGPVDSVLIRLRPPPHVHRGREEVPEAAQQATGQVGVTAEGGARGGSCRGAQQLRHPPLIQLQGQRQLFCNELPDHGVIQHRDGQAGGGGHAGRGAGGTRTPGAAWLPRLARPRCPLCLGLRLQQLVELLVEGRHSALLATLLRTGHRL